MVDLLELIPDTDTATQGGGVDLLDAIPDPDVSRGTETAPEPQAATPQRDQSGLSLAGSLGFQGLGGGLGAPPPEPPEGFGEGTSRFAERTGKSFVGGLLNVESPIEANAQRFFESNPRLASEAQFHSGTERAQRLIRESMGEASTADKAINAIERFSESANQVVKERIDPFFKSLETPPPEGLSDRIADTIGGLGAFVSRLAIAKKLIAPAELPVLLETMLAFELESSVRGEPVGEGAALGGAFGVIQAIPAKTISGEAAKILAESGLLAGVTAAEGGDLTDIIIAGLIPPALKGAGLARGEFRKQLSEAKTADEMLDVVRRAKFFANEHAEAQQFVSNASPETLRVVRRRFEGREDPQSRGMVELIDAKLRGENIEPAKQEKPDGQEVKATTQTTAEAKAETLPVKARQEITPQRAPGQADVEQLATGQERFRGVEAPAPEAGESGGLVPGGRRGDVQGDGGVPGDAGVQGEATDSGVKSGRGRARPKSRTPQEARRRQAIARRVSAAGQDEGQIRAIEPAVIDEPAQRQFSRAAVRRQLEQAASNLPSRTDQVEQLASADVITVEPTTQFAGRIPTEVLEALEHIPRVQLNKVVKGNVTGAQGEDFIAQLEDVFSGQGTDIFVEFVEQALGGTAGNIRRTAGRARLAAEFDPSTALLGVLEQTAPVKGDRIKQSVVNPNALPDGTRFSINRQVFELNTDADNVRRISGDEDDLPIELITSLPVDDGSVSIPGRPKKPFKESPPSPKDLIGRPLPFGSKTKKLFPEGKDLPSTKPEDKGAIARKFDEKATPTFEESGVIGEIKPQAAPTEQGQAGTEARRSADEPLPPIPPRPGTVLEGGKEAGSTIIANELAEEVVASIARIAGGVRKAAVGIGKLSKRFLMRGVDFIETQGEAGAGIASEVREIDRLASKRAKSAEVDIRNTLKGLNRSQREQAMRALNGRSSADNAPDFITARSNRVREILDNALLVPAQELGMERLLPGGQKIPVGGSGKAFPQTPNAAGNRFLDEAQQSGLASPRVYRFARQLVENGKAADMEDALVQIKKFRDFSRRGVVPYLERTRIELPEEFVEWDPVLVLPGVLERGALAIEGVRKWGPDFAGLDSQITELSAQTDPGIATKIDRFLKHEFGVGGEVTADDTKAAGALSNYQTTVRLGGSLISAFRNSLQRFVNTVDYPLPVLLKAGKDFPPFINQWISSANQVKERIEKTGVVRSFSELGTIETGVPGQRVTQLALKPFTLAETGNQTFSAIVARHGVERDINRLIALEGKEGPTARLMDILARPVGQDIKGIQRRLERQGIGAEKLAGIITSGGRLTPDQIEEVMNRLVLDTQFPITLATKPLWWSTNPWLRLAFKFKTFGVRQTALIYNVALKELFKGNIAPFARFVVWTILAGELYNIARDYLVGAEESLTNRLINRPDERNLRDISLRLMADMADGGGLGMLADLTFGVGSFAGGPVLSTLENVSEATLDIVKRPSQTLTALGELAKKEISIARQTAIIARIDKALINENNNLLAYRLWRRRGFEFREEKEGKGIVQSTLEDIIEGFPDFRRTDRTLIYEYAARQISVGDVDDAADYLADLLRDASPQDRKSLEKGMKISMRAKSPLGPVAKRDRTTFLNKFKPEDRRKALRLQDKWISDYERAINKAVVRSRVGSANQ